MSVVLTTLFIKLWFLIGWLEEGKKTSPCIYLILVFSKLSNLTFAAALHVKWEQTNEIQRHKGNDAHSVVDRTEAEPLHPSLKYFLLSQTLMLRDEIYHHLVV